MNLSLLIDLMMLEYPKLLGDNSWNSETYKEEKKNPNPVGINLGEDQIF